MADEPYITVRAEIVGDKIKAYVTGSNLQEGHPIYEEFSQRAISLARDRGINDFANTLGNNLEVTFTLTD
jgi:hypothetical protein